MLKSLAKFGRSRGYAAREILQRLKKLRPLSRHLGLDDDDAGPLDYIIRRMEGTPELSNLLNGRDSLLETGHVPQTESEHTLKIPLASAPSTDTEFLCFTRLGEEKWACYRDRIRGQLKPPQGSSGLGVPGAP